jgi:hypothetical protein
MKPHAEPDGDPFAALPTYDVDPQTSERIRTRALEVLTTTPLRSGAFSHVLHIWTSVIEPSLVAGAVVVYLLWTVEVLGALHP